MDVHLDDPVAAAVGCANSVRVEELLDLQVKLNLRTSRA
jgi:hypothetical protein